MNHTKLLFCLHSNTEKSRNRRLIVNLVADVVSAASSPVIAGEDAISITLISN